MNTLINESIDFYAKLLKVPTFRNYEEIVRQLDKKAGYGDFLLEVIKKMSMTPDRLPPGIELLKLLNFLI